MMPEQAQEKAVDRIRAVASAGGDTLALGDLPLTSLPDELFELKTLRILILGACRYDADQDVLLIRKKSGSMHRPLTSLAGLERLTGLRHLDLSRLSNLTAIPEVSELKSLASLNLYGCTSLRSLPELQSLTQLTSLNLEGCTSLCSLPELQKLTQLTALCLSSFATLRSLPELQNLTQLTSLSLQSLTSLRSLPELQNLTQLKSLTLQGFTSLTELPGLETLDKLTAVNMGGCTGLTSLPSLASLRALTTLRLQGCRALKSLPDFGINGSLALINMEACGALGSFSPLQPLLKTLSELYLHGTYFDDLPAELCGSDSGDNVLPGVQAHLVARNQQGDHEDRECKILVLGNGRVGKTSLVKQLLGQPHDLKELSTHGIQLWTWEPKIQLQDDNKPESVRVNIWDFGGQDLYHNTHRLFISSRAVFVLVWEATSPSCGSGDADVDPLDKKRP
jgi:internalin A